MKKILLISGGFDSLLIYEQKKDCIDECIYLDYGHRFLEKELSVLSKTGIPYKILHLRKLREKEGFFYGRNMSFFIAVREHFLHQNICVYFGHNADDNYNDNTRYFLNDVERVINNSYPTSTLRIICPLESFTKQEIIAQYKNTSLCKEGILPYFCDLGEDHPCGKCHSCQAMIDARLL